MKTTKELNVKFTVPAEGYDVIAMLKEQLPTWSNIKIIKLTLHVSEDCEYIENGLTGWMSSDFDLCLDFDSPAITELKFLTQGAVVEGRIGL